VQPLPLLNGVEAFLVTGFDEARAVLADPRFSADKVRHPDATSRPASGVRPPADTPREDGMFIFMDPPEHTRLRRLLTGQFTVRRMKALEARAREVAVEHIEAMRVAGTSADLVTAYALPIPSLMICELLGVDYADHDEFQHNTAVPLSTSATEQERADAARAQYRFLKRLVAHKREHPADDLMSGLVQADPPLTDQQLVDLALLLLGAGHETTANMLALGTMALLANPDQLAALRADPTLIDATVEELMRFLTISQIGVTRVAVADVPVGDVVVPAGATVILGLPEANRDPRLYADPDRLDVTRPRTAHLGFGHGIHQCLGQQLARIEMRVGFTELFTRLPDLRLAVPAEDVPLRNDMIVFGVHALPVTWS
jgi:cytochrome P450